MRDNFSAKTLEILAKRVAYKCSNPNCRQATVGPNSDPSKLISIGVGAHVTAASKGGPRYASNLSKEERSSINNGIWLCQNCAVLIDRNITLYTVNLLNDWKSKAENEAFLNIQAGNYQNIPIKDKLRPYAEAELIWKYSSKNPLGLSERNPADRPKLISQAIWWNNIVWNYELKIYNNSSINLYNIKIKQYYLNNSLRLREKPNKINNILPYRDLGFNAEVSTTMEGTGKEAEDVMRHTFPALIQGSKFLLEYYGENRESFFTELKLINDELIITHYTERPNDYSDFT